MVTAGGISLTLRSLLFTTSGSKPHLVTSMLGSGADPKPETPLLMSLAVPKPRCASMMDVGERTQLYCRLPLQSSSVVTDWPAWKKGAGMVFVMNERLILKLMR